MGQLMTVMTRYWPQEEARASTPSDIVQEEDVDGDQGTDGRATQDDRGSAALIPEALPNIKLLVNHELPDGSGNEHNITFHPRSIVSQLRATMETFSGIPQDNIYFLFKTTLLEDNRSLFEQQVGAYDRITMRDSRLTYPYPY